MSKIYDFPLYYNIIRRYILFAFRHFYGEFIIIGKDNIPKNGPYILAPNHLNALMDALAAQYIVPRTMPVVFLAKADIFKQSHIAKLLRITKILPAYRMQDGIAQIEKNKEVFQLCIETLMNKKALGIMPEGNQGEQRNLRPLKKGLVRIALEARQSIETTTKLHIIPIGIDLSNLEKFGTRIIINIGKPIEVNKSTHNHVEQTVYATNKLQNRLRDEMMSLMVHIQPTKYYEPIETILHIVSSSIHPQGFIKSNSIERFYMQQRLATRLNIVEHKEPQKLKKLVELVNQFQSITSKNDLNHWAAISRKSTSIQLGVELCLLVTFLPIFIVGFFLNCIPLYLTSIIRKSIKIDYSGFISSVKLAIAGILFPLVYSIQTALFYNQISSSIPWTTAILVSHYLCGKMALRWFVLSKVWYYTMKYQIHKWLHRKTCHKQEKIQKEIMQLVL